MVLQAEYIVGIGGEKKSVVLSLRQYRKMLEYVEDLEDSLDLKKAKASTKGFVDLKSFTASLKRKALL